MSETVYYNKKINSTAVLVIFNSIGIISSHSLGLLTRIGSGMFDIPVYSAAASPEHGIISRQDGEYRYMDCNSADGTYINGRLIAAGTVKTLQDGDILGFGTDPDKDIGDGVFGLFTTTVSADCVWDCIALEGQISEICIGRAFQSSLKLENETVSEKHASFFFRENTWAVIDHNSTNGVYLNGRRLSAPRYLEKFDVVSIADTLFIYTGKCLLYSDNNAQKNFGEPEPIPVMESDTVTKESQLIINITERSVTRNFKKKYLLQDINISVSAGEMILILGGSGAGKTTFINAVMGYEKAVGKIVYKDTDVYEDYSKMKYEIGFVPQQDLLRGTDTVYNTLSNSAEMKLPRETSFEEREARIEEVLEEMGLSREKNTLVSKLSGGQRKRLNIAVELIADPGLFFLDEPDSGVDDIMGRGLMENLRGIADRGKIVMIITHSPERAADLFDKVIVLAKSAKDNCGYLAFYGSPKKAFEFFGVDNFRGIVKKINRPDENGEGLSDYFIEKYRDYRGDGKNE